MPTETGTVPLPGVESEPVSAIPLPAGPDLSSNGGVPVPDSGPVILRPGTSSQAILQVQQALHQRGFYQKSVDGNFGPGTLASVNAFQQAQGLPVSNGVDAGTLFALGFTYTVTNPPPLRSGVFTPDFVSRLFPQVPMERIQTYLPWILSALEEQDLADAPMVCMALATIRVETGGFTPLSEYQSAYNTSPNGHPFDKYDFRKDLGNHAMGDGARFRGRGFIQLTGRFNYTHYSDVLGLGTQLVEDPELANDPQIAAKLLSAFLKAQEAGIRQALNAEDYATARRLVNGGSNGLGVFATTYQSGLMLAAG